MSALPCKSELLFEHETYRTCILKTSFSGRVALEVGMKLMGLVGIVGKNAAGVAAVVPPRQSIYRPPNRRSRSVTHAKIDAGYWKRALTRGWCKLGHYCFKLTL